MRGFRTGQAVPVRSRSLYTQAAEAGRRRLWRDLSITEGLALRPSFYTDLLSGLPDPIEQAAGPES